MKNKIDKQMKKIKSTFLCVAATMVFTACKKDVDPIIIINNNASTGSERIQLNGIAGNEAGSAAGNAVYIDFSTDKLSTSLRAGWDLGFYSGSDFRVILNNTTSAGAKVLTKVDLNTVTAADTIGLTLATSQTAPEISFFAFFDNLNGDINQTVIPSISVTDASSPVVILNRGTGGGIAPRAWIKLRVLRNGTGYTVQYAGIQETVFRTINIAKNDLYHFQYLSFENGLVTVEPEKLKWDIVWTYAQYQANFGAGFVPYNFSDLIALNHLTGVQAKEKIYADATIANAAYAAFNRDSINVNPVTTGRWTIANNWRSTQPATGAKLDRFYVVKDANGNFYKLKCLAMGVGTDGGTRGKPEFKYALIR
jgi:HmuY protein